MFILHLYHVLCNFNHKSQVLMFKHDTSLIPLRLEISHRDANSMLNNKIEDILVLNQSLDRHPQTSHEAVRLEAPQLFDRMETIVESS